MKITQSACRSAAMALMMFGAVGASAVERQMGTDFSNLPQRLIVQYTDGASRDWHAQAAQLSARGGAELRHMRAMGLKDRQLFRLQKRRSPQQLQALMDRLRADPMVQSVEVDRLLQAHYTPNDTFYANQWHYYEATGGINMPAAWDKQSGTNVVVAVLDTGYTDHSDLAANILPGYDFIGDTFVANDGDGRDADAHDPGDWMDAHECGIFNPPSFTGSSWHGTHTAGTVAAVTGNNQGVAGVSFDAMVLPVRVLGKCGGYTSDIADGIVWASGGSVSGVPANPNPAQVINMSLGGGGSCDSTTQAAIDAARANGATVVVSAGNSDDNAANYTPASCNGVVTVAASDRQGNRAYYSNYGSAVDVTAPGGETNQVGSDGVASTLNDGSTTPGSDIYVYYQGTSMAAPHVAGAAALLYAANPGVTPDEVETALQNTARPLPGSCSGGCGAGIIDASAAIDAVGGGGGNLPPTASFSHSADLLTVTFTDSSSDSDGTVTGWDWDFGDGNGSSLQNPVHSYASSGTYTVTLTVTDDQGAQDAAMQDVSVSDGAPTSDGFTLTGLDFASKEWKYYTIDVPANADRLEVETSGGTGNVNLFVKFGAQPTNRDYDCKDGGGGNNESCSIASPSAGTWHIGVKATRNGAAGVRLDAYWYDD